MSSKFLAVVLTSLAVIGTPILYAAGHGGSRGSSGSHGSKTGGGSGKGHTGKGHTDKGHTDKGHTGKGHAGKGHTDKSKHHRDHMPRADEAPVQTVRYLRINNQTGEELKIWVKGSDGETRVWTFAPEKISYLAVDEERIAESEVLIWASSETKVWNSRKVDALELVPQPYRAHQIGTYNYNFR
jgi:hypothetical protein